MPAKKVVANPAAGRMDAASSAAGGLHQRRDSVPPGASTGEEIHDQVRVETGGWGKEEGRRASPPPSSPPHRLLAAGSSGSVAGRGREAWRQRRLGEVPPMPPEGGNVGA